MFLENGTNLYLRHWKHLNFKMLYDKFKKFYTPNMTNIHNKGTQHG